MRKLMQLLVRLAHAMFHLYVHNELPALFGFLFVEEAGIPLPLPGDTLLLYAGTHHNGAIGYGLIVILIAILAVFCGSSLLYYIMRRGGRPVLDRYGKWLHISPQRLEKIEGWFRRHGSAAIIVGRLIPGMRIPTTVMAGISEVPYRTFLASTFAAAVIWSVFYYFLGLLVVRAYRHAVALVTGDLDIFSGLIVLLILLGVVATTVLLVRRQRQMAAARKV